MDMDTAPLNKAHQLERKAEKLKKQNKIDDSIQCHIEAVQLFDICLQKGDNKKVLESIRLQKQWNERQILTLQLKKSYLERAEKEKSTRVNPSNTSKKSVENIEANIFRNFETHDSLICYLAEGGIIHSPQYPAIEKTNDQEAVIKGNKHPKDDSTVIEELKELSGQLRESVQDLLIKLDDRNKEIELLRTQVEDLEMEKSCKDVSKNEDF